MRARSAALYGSVKSMCSTLAPGPSKKVESRPQV